MKDSAIALKKQGMSNRQIAEVLGIGKSTVDKYIRQAGLSTFEQDKEARRKLLERVIELRRTDHSYHQISNILGIARTTVQTYAVKAGLRKRRDMAATRKIYEDIIRMKEAGFSTAEISERTGIPCNTLRVYLWRSGYKSQDFRWVHMRIRKDFFLTLKAAAEVRNTKPEDIAKRLIEAIVADKLIDSVLDDGDER